MSSLETDDFGKEARERRGRRGADLHRGLSPHSLGKLAPPHSCFCALIQGPTRLFLSDCHGPVSFPCPRARSGNKELQFISCEAKWDASAIQSHTLRRLQLAQVPSPRPRGWTSRGVACCKDQVPRTVPYSLLGVTTGRLFSEAGGTQATV